MLAAYPLFPAFTNSPEDYITAGITATDTTIPVHDLSLYPPAPNIAVLNPGGTDAETFYYATKSAESGAGNLTGCVRGYYSTGTYGVAKAWDINTRLGRNYTAYDHASILASISPIAPSGATGEDMTLSQDNNGNVRRFFKDDFSNNSIGAYTVTGTPSIASGVLTMAYGDKIIRTLESTCTAGKWWLTAQFDTAYDATVQYAYLYFGATSYLRVQRHAGNAIYLRLVVNDAELIAATDTTATLADDTDGHAFVTFDGTNYQMYWGKTAVGSATAGSAPATPSIGVLDYAASAITLGVTVNEMGYAPGVAFTDPLSADTETRYSQLASTDLTTWTAAAAGDVVVDTGNTKMTLASDDDRGIIAALKGMYFGSGEYEFAFDNLCDGGGEPETIGFLLAYHDHQNFYRIYLNDDTDGTRTLYLAKNVASTSSTTITSADVSSSTTRGNKTWVKIQWDAPTGRFWIYHRDDSAAYPATPTLTGYDTSFRYGRAGFRIACQSAGAGNLTADFFPYTIRAECHIGETNTTATDATYYFRTDFSEDELGRWEKTYGTSATLTAGGAGGVLSYVGGTTTRTIIRLRGQQLSYGTYYFTLNNKHATNESSTVNLLFGWDGAVWGSGYMNNGYAAAMNPYTDTIALYKNVDGTQTTLTSTTGTAISFNVAYPCKVVWSSSGLIEFYVDTGSGYTLIISATDTTYSSGYIGFRDAVTTAASTNYEIDNLEFIGTRAYPSHMLLGAQVGSVLIGSTVTPCTRLVDHFHFDSIAEYTQTYRTSTVDANLCTIGSTDTSAIQQVNSVKFGSGFYRQKHAFKSVGSSYYVFTLIGWSGATVSNMPVSCYRCQHRADNGYIILNYVAADGTVTQVGSTADSGTMAANTLYYLDVTWDTATGLITVTVRDITGKQLGSAISATDTNITTPGYAGIVQYSGSSSHITPKSFEVNALMEGATNGCAVVIGGVNRGSRFDQQEEGSISLTNPNVASEGVIATCARTTYAAGQDWEIYFRNNTDATAINWDGQTTATLTAGTAATDGVCRALLRYQDLGDTIKLAARRRNYSGVTYDNQPAVFVHHLTYAPMWGV